jgi:AICAR transformylase/IMP cyclohydrolase PurH
MSCKNNVDQVLEKIREKYISIHGNKMSVGDYLDYKQSMDAARSHLKQKTITIPINEHVCPCGVGQNPE